MRKLFITIGVICFILTMQLITVTKTQSTSDSNLKKEVDAYKENYHDPDLLKKKGEIYYQKLLSPDFKERQHAVYFFSHFKKEELNEKLLKAVADLLKREIERRKEVLDIIRKTGSAENLPKDLAYLNSESYGMYHAYMCRTAGKSGDKSLLSLMIEKCLRPEVIINFGDDAVEPVIDIILTPSVYPIRKSSAIRVLGGMLKPKKEGYVASGERRNKIKKILIQATTDDDRHIRQVSVRALGDSGDEDVIPILEKIAESDPFLVRKKDAKGNVVKEYYLIRKEAQKALKKLREKDLEE